MMCPTSQETSQAKSGAMPTQALDVQVLVYLCVGNVTKLRHRQPYGPVAFFSGSRVSRSQYATYFLQRSGLEGKVTGRKCKAETA